MNFILGAYVFLIGIVIGSFLNVVIYRYNTGVTLGGRSICFSCGKKLRWYELVPLFSFLIQRGKCRGCRSKISWQYPLIELLTGLLFLGAFLVASQDIPRLVYLCVQLSLLVVIGVYDLRHKIIPDVFSYLFASLALGYVVYQFFAGGLQWGDIAFNVLAGPLYFLPFAAMWYFSKGTWMGFGDAKLALGIGWFLGLEYTYIAMMISFWSGALVGLGLIVYGKLMHRSKDKTLNMKSEIPFGPFLILGLLSMLFFGPFIERFLSLFLF